MHCSYADGMRIRVGLALAMMLVTAACGSNAVRAQRLSAVETSSTAPGSVTTDSPSSTTSSTLLNSAATQPECAAGSSVRPARPLSESEMQEIQDWIVSSPSTKGQLSYALSREAQGLVEADFFSHAAGRAAAAATHERWGRGVCVMIADHPYPKGAWPDATKCTPLSADAPDRNIATSVRLDTPSVPRGVTATGVATVTNHGPAEVEFSGGRGPAGAVVKPGGSDPLARDFGVHTAEGYMYKIPPGKSVEMPVTVSTNDCRPDTDYAVPAGDYEVIIAGGRLGPIVRVPLTITA